MSTPSSSPAGGAPKPDLPSPGTVALIADLAHQASDPAIVSIPTDGLGAGLPKKVPVLWDRAHQSVIDLGRAIEAHRQDPARRKGTAKAETLQSFIDLVKRHQDDDSAIFATASWPNPKLTAVIDYHTAAHAPRWGAHRVVYEFPLTDEFKAWVERDAKPMEQLAFAAFLEEHAAELAAPFDGEVAEFELLFREKFATPAELIALSRDLEVHVNSKVKRQERLSNGERTIEFTEEHAAANGEKVTIPGIFIVNVPAFVDGEAVRIPARLRYRVANGSIHWFYQLYRWETWLRAQVKSDLARAGRDTGLPTFEACPEPIA